ncbi:hypothetical protein HAHE_36110 [Haloferula helveola]|uniref:Uncharacterized protein n=1 Tax=Haloferula helveola TaxID=490095 RepID=A0ABM7RH99_9BACT|nr:hypothetical protein HAHE_36110 [Haloferula helveola]
MELMVTIVIVAVLATLAFMGLSRATESAKIATNMNNLRNLAPIVTGIADDEGAYPPGWSFSQGESWADLVVREMSPDSYQNALLLSPFEAKDIDPGLKQTAISNYGVNPIIFPAQGYAGERAYRVTPPKLQRPSEQILLGDALPRSSAAPYGFSMVVWWGLRTTTGNTGSPPTSPRNRAGRSVSLPSNIAEMTDCGGKGLPAFRNRGKGHFLFADGHVEALLPDDLKFKHFAISY